MKPVLQTIFGSPDGNCFQAGIASILDVGIEEIPFFGVDEWWFGRARDFVKTKGRDLIFLPKEWGVDSINAYHLISGRSRRGYRHVVVGLESYMVHDPHPEGTGLVSIDGLFILPNSDWEDVVRRHEDKP